MNKKMNKKSVLTIGVALSLALGCIFSNSNAYGAKNMDILTLFSSKPKSENSLWVGTFQLAFNEMKNNVIKNDIIFEKEKPTKELKGLNQGK